MGWEGERVCGVNREQREGGSRGEKICRRWESGERAGDGRVKGKDMRQGAKIVLGRYKVPAGEMVAARKGSEWGWRTRTYIRKLLWSEDPECLKWKKSTERGSERGREKGQHWDSPGVKWQPEKALLTWPNRPTWTRTLDPPGPGPSTEARAPGSVPDGPHNRGRYTQRREAVSLSLANISVLNTGCLSCSHLERDPITVRTEERRQGCVLWRGRQKGSKEILAPNVSKFSRPTVRFYRWRDLSIKKWKSCLDHLTSWPQTSVQCTCWPPSVMERKGKKRPRECRDLGN